MLKHYFSTRSRRSQYLHVLTVVLLVAIVGTILLNGSHAASPYISSTADSGTLSSGAVKQTCSGASDGACVVFNGITNGAGGSNMYVGMNAGGWGNGTPGETDVATAVNFVREGVPGSDPPSQWKTHSVKMDIDFFGDSNGNYNSGGVSALNPTNWANWAVSWYQSNCVIAGYTSECPMLEVLNEPGGSWFWGPSAMSTTNAAAYATLLATTYTAFHAALGANAPLILASYDGGGAGTTQWGQEVWAAAAKNPAIGNMNNYVDGITMHPYGGTSNATLSAQGNRASVTAAHTQTGKLVYITEVGWPTAVGQPSTGDSLQWSQTEQCNNIYNFIGWARSTGYVNAVSIFNYADYGTNDFYGVVGPTGAHKPAYNGLKAAAQNLANPC